MPCRSENSFAAMRGIGRFMKPKRIILVVEDEAPVANLVVLLLKRTGHNPKTARRAGKASKSAAGSGFDLIPLDVDMPGVNGFTLCQRLSKNPQLKGIPVIFVSNRISAADHKRAVQLGVPDYILKPAEASEFISRIKSHLQPKNRSAAHPSNHQAAP